MILHLRPSFAILAIGFVLLFVSCKKENDVPDTKEPIEEVDSTFHVFNQHIDSGFVFGSWELVCYKTTSVYSSPPYQTIINNNCAEHPIYKFEPEGLLYISTANQLGGNTLIDSAMYWYNANESKLSVVAYKTETNPSNELKYIVVGPINQQTVSYSNDSMYWLQTTGGSATANKSFVRKD